MSGNAEQLLNDLHKVLADIEALAKAAASATGDGATGALEHARAALGKARARVEAAQESLGDQVMQGARSADSYVRENPWLSLGIAAAVAFVLGALSGRRNR